MDGGDGLVPPVRQEHRGAVGRLDADGHTRPVRHDRVVPPVFQAVAGDRVLDDQKPFAVNLVDDKELLAGNSEGSGNPLPVLADSIRRVPFPGADVEGGIGAAAHTPDTCAKPVQNAGNLQKFFALQDRDRVFSDQLQHHPSGRKAGGTRLIARGHLPSFSLPPLALRLTPFASPSKNQ